MTAIASFEPCQCHISGLERERVDPRQVEQCPVLQSHACMIGLLRLQLCGAQHRAEFDGRHRAFAEPLERQSATAREQPDRSLGLAEIEDRKSTRLNYSP